MKIKHVSTDPQSMSQDGGKILKSLQNNHMPLIDLVVRESLQNSLDATIKSQDTTNVDYNISLFKTKKLAIRLEELEDTLIDRYKEEEMYLSIRDTNTYGLTGDFESTDIEELEQSNFHKLVFGIGKNQSQEGAGGSWGYGKTSYFRLGNGIVLYYTRVRKENDYEERLIASIIEDPKKEECLLNNKVNTRGIAWWGRYSDEGDQILPITDEGEISNILDIFGIEPYQDKETGTTIIIPFIQEDDVDTFIDSKQLFHWEHTLEDKIAMSVQRWYFPRLLNTTYQEFFGSSKLLCKVNDRLINSYGELEPVFEVYQEIYNAALRGESKDNSIKVEKITLGQNALRNTKEAVGYVAFKEVSQEELQMLPPNNKQSGLAYIGVRDKDLLEKNMANIIAYCRKPGMVVEYSVNDKWLKESLPIEEGKLFLGFFVPNSEAVLIDRYVQEGYKNLEEYLRLIEASDHANWEDNVGYTIVKRMRDYTNRVIKNAYRDAEKHINTSVTSALSRKFGNLLLPPANYGRSSNRVTERRMREGGPRRRGADISISRVQHLDSKTMEIGFKAFIKEKRNEVFLQILTQDGRMNHESWVKAFDDNVPFPFTIENVNITKINDNKYSDSGLQDKIKIANIKELTKIEIDIIELKEVDIEGSFTMSVESNQYMPSLAIKTV